MVLKDNSSPNKLKGNTWLVIGKNNNEIFEQELFSFFGNNKSGDYILNTSFLEKNENILVKNNQVAEKINYELIIEYTIFFKNKSCNIYKKKLTTKFSFLPKSFGYNFGADRSLEKLYKNSVRKNMQDFINSIPTENICLK